MSGEPQIRVVKVPAIPIHPDLIARYERNRGEIKALMTPDAYRQLEEAEADAARRVITGTGLGAPDQPGNPSSN
jgi:hypothetical protein